MIRVRPRRRGPRISSSDNCRFVVRCQFASPQNYSRRLVVRHSIRHISTALLVGAIFFHPLAGQQKNDKPSPVPSSPPRTNELTQLSPEPLMRIALSTDVRSATISTTAQLLNTSDADTAPQPLESARVRVESRLLSPS